MNVHGEPGQVIALAAGGIATPGTDPAVPAALRFELFEHGGVPHARVELALQAGARVTVVRGILVVVPALARNDGGAVYFPREFGALIDEAASAALTTFLLAHLRMLTRGRVIPFDHTLRFAPCSAYDAYRGTAST